MRAPVAPLVEGGMIAWRNLLHVRRSVDWVFAAVVQPIMFVLLFGFIFGGLLGGAAYREFLVAGIVVQTLAFNSAFTVLGLATDLREGMIDRLRSLPISRAAVMVGRTLSDLAVSVVALVVMSLCGLLIGWRIRGSVLDAITAYCVLLLFAFAMSWIGALIGLVAPSPEVAQSAGLIWLTPLTFVSSGFVPESSLPAPLRAVAAAEIDIDMVLQNVSGTSSGRTDITFTVARSNGPEAVAELEKIAGEVGFEEVVYDDNVGKVSLVGAGMRSHPGVTATFCEALSDAGVNIEIINTSEIRISVLIRDTQLADAVSALHSAFELGGEEEAVVYAGSGR